MLIPAKSRTWWRLLLTYHGTALPRIKWRLLCLVGVSLLVTWVHDSGAMNMSLPHLTTIPFSLVGVALGIFLGFRNNSSYDRYWEGRKKWGSLVNTSRSFTRMVLTVLVAPDNERGELDALKRDMVHRTAAFVHGLRGLLRKRDVSDDLARLLPADEVERLRDTLNPPLLIIQGTSERVAHARKRGWLHDFHLGLLEEQLTSFIDIQGGCERIRNTPIPFSYSALIHRIVAVYCFGLPFGLVETTERLTPLVVLLISYAFLGLDAVGDEIEEPFGLDTNDLPLESLSRMIEANVRTQLGETDLPPLLQPDADGTLR